MDIAPRFRIFTAVPVKNTSQRLHFRLHRARVVALGQARDISKEKTTSPVTITSPHQSSVDELSKDSWPSPAALKAAFSTTYSSNGDTQDLETEVLGSFPAWLRGCLLRNGPGTYDNKDPQHGMVHMFDGYAVLLKCDIDGPLNKVKMSFRYLESKAWKEVRDGGHMRWREFATPVPRDRGPLMALWDVCQTILGAAGIGQGVTDNASVNIIAGSTGKTALAVTETVVGTYEFDMETLETRGPVVFQQSDGLKGDLTSAHPSLLVDTDQLVNILCDPVMGFTLYKTSRNIGDTKRTVIASGIPHRRIFSPSWIHDFPASQQHAVLPQTPLYFDLPSLIFGGLKQPNSSHTMDENFYFFMKWRREDGSLLRAVRIKDGHCYPPTPAPPFFVFHWANAFESDCGRYLHLDAAMYDDAEIVRHLSLDNLVRSRNGSELPTSKLQRVTIDLQNPTAQATVSCLIDDNDTYGSFIEFPCINSLYAGRKNRYVWGTAAVRPTNVNNAIAKFDLETRKCVGLWHEPGGIVGEPRFVPRHDSQASRLDHNGPEDDGVVLAVVILPDGRSALVCLDGPTHTELARAVFPDTVRITNGFHGTFCKS